MSNFSIMTPCWRLFGSLTQRVPQICCDRYEQSFLNDCGDFLLRRVIYKLFLRKFLFVFNTRQLFLWLDWLLVYLHNYFQSKINEILYYDRVSKSINDVLLERVLFTFSVKRFVLSTSVRLTLQLFLNFFSLRIDAVTLKPDNIHFQLFFRDKAFSSGPVELH